MARAEVWWWWAAVAAWALRAGVAVAGGCLPGWVGPAANVMACSPLLAVVWANRGLAGMWVLGLGGGLSQRRPYAGCPGGAGGGRGGGRSG